MSGVKRKRTRLRGRLTLPNLFACWKQTGVYDVATAKDQLVDIIKTTDCDGFTSEIIEEYDDYVRATYTSPTLGFVDDVEFWFTRDDRSTVEVISPDRGRGKTTAERIGIEYERYGKH